jgi:hypothetical protein
MLPRDGLNEELQALRVAFRRLKDNACDPAARMREASDEPHGYGIGTNDHDNRRRLRARQCGTHGLKGYGRDNVSSRGTDLAGKAREAIGVTLRITLDQFEIPAKLETMVVKNPQQFTAPGRSYSGRGRAVDQEADAPDLFLCSRRLRERE